MAAATWVHVSQAVRQTRTGVTTFADVPGAVIPSSSFIAGKQYLLLVTAVCDQNGTNAVAHLRMRHGATDFPTAYHAEEPDVATTSKMQYGWMTVWTAVATEDVLLRFATTPSTGLVGVDQIEMWALKLSDDFEEGVDWFFNENVATVALTASESTTNNASITFTPAVADQKWWIIGSASDDHSADAASFYSFQHRLNRTGEATETTDEVIKETEDVDNGKYVSLLSCVKTLGAASNTFFIGSLLSTTGTTGDDRLASAVFALNIERFAQFVGEYTAAGVDLSATDYATNLATGTLTPAATDDVFVFGKFAHNPNTVGIWGQGRIQFDNADVVANTTTEAYNVEDVHDARDQCTIAQLGVVTGVTAAAHTVDLDGSLETAAAGRNALYRTLVAFTKELAAGGAFTLTAESGTFALTGNAASLERGYQVAATSGALALAGTAASLERGYRVAAESGSFVLTGQDVAFPRTYILAAVSGGFALTGTAAGLPATRLLAAGSGTFVLTGTAADLRRGRTLTAESGSFALTGTVADLRAGRRLAAGPGAFALTGTAASLRYDRILVAGSGVFILTGQDADLLVGVAAMLRRGIVVLDLSRRLVVLDASDYGVALNRSTYTAELDA